MTGKYTPIPTPDVPDRRYDDETHQGISLRDWFAGQALAALIGKAPFFDRDGEHGQPVADMQQFKADMAASAYGYADAMLAARGAK